MGRDRANLSPGTRGRPTVLGATARVCDEDGNHKGQGLVLALPNGVVVLTCHHVIASIEPGGVGIALPGDHGRLRAPVPATFDASRSRPERDAVVLRIAINTAPPRPLLHALDPATYEGRLSEPATGYTHMSPDTFDAWVRQATRLDLEVPNRGAWPDPPQRYEIPDAFRLAVATDVREGVSGAVVAYEGGVLGLAHFARDATAAYERELYLVPLSTWADGWPELETLIEPLIDQRLHDATNIARRVRDVTVGISNPTTARAPDLVIAGYREDVHMTRPEAQAARRALVNGLLIIGRPRSGKTRLAWDLIRTHPDAVLVMPHEPRPPTGFEIAGLRGRQIIVLCDDLHRDAEQFRPTLWKDAFANCCAHPYLIATTRDGLEWQRVRDNQTVLLDAIGESGRVFTSKTPDGGTDLSFAAGRRFARQHGLEDVFRRLFDGTPGSLTLGLNHMQARYERLNREHRAEVAASRLLDSVKLLYVGGQTNFLQRLVRDAAEQIRGDRPLSAETWEWLCRRTQEEGFGGFNPAGDFQTYDPYLEQCVGYTPTPSDLDRLATLLRSRGDSQGLAHLATASDQRAAVLDTSIRWMTELDEYLLLTDLHPRAAYRPEVSTALRVQLADLRDHLASLPGTDNVQLAYELRRAVNEVLLRSDTLILTNNVLQEHTRSGSTSVSSIAIEAEMRVRERRHLSQAVDRLRDLLIQLRRTVDL